MAGLEVLEMGISMVRYTDAYQRRRKRRLFTLRWAALRSASSSFWCLTSDGLCEMAFSDGAASLIVRENLPLWTCQLWRNISSLLVRGIYSNWSVSEEN